MSDLDTIPAQVEIGLAEIYPLAMDFTSNARVGSEAIINVAAELVDLADLSDQAAAIAGPPVINGMMVQVILLGQYLQADHRYRLRITATFSGMKVLTMRAVIWPRE